MTTQNGTYAIVNNGHVTSVVVWDGENVIPGGGALPDNALPYTQLTQSNDNPAFYEMSRQTVVTDTSVVDHEVPVLARDVEQRILRDMEINVDKLRATQVTVSAGQTMEYEQKLEEAIRVLANPDAATLADYPMLAHTEVAINGRTLLEAANAVTDAKLASQRCIIAVAVVRTKIKKMLSQCATDAEKYYCYKAFDFDSEFQTALQTIQSSQ